MFCSELSDGSTIRSRSVLCATGVSWRRLDVPGTERLLHAGVYYGSATSEAPGVRGKDVLVIGGGNSAGPEQADRPWAATLRERWLRYNTETSTDASPRAGARHPETGADPGDEHRPQTGEHHRATPAQDRTLAGVVAAPLGATERRTAVGLVVPCRVRWSEVDQHRGSVREDHEEQSEQEEKRRKHAEESSSAFHLGKDGLFGAPARSADALAGLTSLGGRPGGRFPQRDPAAGPVRRSACGTEGLGRMLVESGGERVGSGSSCGTPVVVLRSGRPSSVRVRLPPGVVHRDRALHFRPARPGAWRRQE